MGLRRWAGYTHIAATCPRRAVQPQAALQPLLDQIRARMLSYSESERGVSLYTRRDVGMREPLTTSRA